MALKKYSLIEIEKDSQNPIRIAIREFQKATPNYRLPEPSVYYQEDIPLLTFINRKVKTDLDSIGLAIQVENESQNPSSYNYILRVYDPLELRNYSTEDLKPVTSIFPNAEYIASSLNMHDIVSSIPLVNSGQPYKLSTDVDLSIDQRKVIQLRRQLSDRGLELQLYRVDKLPIGGGKKKKR